MGAALPATHLANLLSLPARHFAVVDVGSQRGRLLLARVSRGQPRVVRTRSVDAHEDGIATAEEMWEEVRQLIRAEVPEAVIIVLPQHLVLQHLFDVPPSDPAQTRALVESEAARIGGLSESAWSFDAVRLQPFGRTKHPLTAAFCRQGDLQGLLDQSTDDPRQVFDIRPGGAALAAAFRAAAPATRDAVLVDLGARHTSVTLLSGGQAIFSASIPGGSSAFTEALVADRGGTLEAAEVLKRTEPPPLAAESSPRLYEAVRAWVAEVERTVSEWGETQPELAADSASWPIYVAGGGTLQPGLLEGLTGLGKRPFRAWPETAGGKVRADFATAWGALLLALGLAGPAPTLLPAEQRGFWTGQRFWRGLVTLNLILAAVLAVVLMLGLRQQTRLLRAKQAWSDEAGRALNDAQDLRSLAEAYNARLEAFRPILERQRQTVETLQLLAALQGQRTNAGHWYVLLADGPSYASGSNDFSAAPPVPRPAESRSSASASTGPATNAPISPRSFVAEVCLVPEGEQMRKALSELVAELKRYPLFRNVDVLPSERRRDLVASNLVFDNRHFALELNLSEAELLPPIPLPRLAPTNREPRSGLRLPGRIDSTTFTNGVRSPGVR